MSQLTSSAPGSIRRYSQYHGAGHRFREVMQALVERQTRGLVVVAQESSAEVSVWELAAGQFQSYRQGDHAALDDLVRTLTPVLWHVVRAAGLRPE